MRFWKAAAAFTTTQGSRTSGRCRQISQNLSAIGNPKGFTMQEQIFAKICAPWEIIKFTMQEQN
jgi:hypothetical protein